MINSNYMNTLIDPKKLVDEFGIKISRLSHKMIKNNDLAKDASQEVWIEILKSLKNFKGDSTISTWIYTIAKKTILKYAVKKRTYSEHEINWYCGLDPLDYSGLEKDKKQWVKEICDECITAFCHCLNNEYRLIFLFHDVSDLTYSQISEIMEIEEDNVRKIVSRYRKKIKNFIERNCILFSDNSTCKCRIKKHVISIDLKQEYNNIAKLVAMVDILKKFDEELPRKSYWEEFI